MLIGTTYVYIRDTQEKWVTQRGSLEFKLQNVLIGKGQGGTFRLLKETEWFLAKMNGHLAEYHGRYDGLWQFVGGWYWLLSLSYDQSSFFLVDEATRERIYDNWILFGGSVFRQIRGAQRECLSFFDVFQVPLVK